MKKHGIKDPVYIYTRPCLQPELITHHPSIFPPYFHGEGHDYLYSYTRAYLYLQL